MGIGTISFLGAARTVTGSCYLLKLPNANVLVDCGIIQGASDSRDRNREQSYYNRELKVSIIFHGPVSLWLRLKPTE